MFCKKWLTTIGIWAALTAAAFAVLGPTTFAARLPFVLVGLFTLALLYRFVLRWLEDRRVARVATLLLLSCVPFLLLSLIHRG